MSAPYDLLPLEPFQCFTSLTVARKSFQVSGDTFDMTLIVPVLILIARVLSTLPVTVDFPALVLLSGHVTPLPSCHRRECDIHCP